MNFFEHQDKANKKTKQLVFLFILGLLFTLLAVNAVIYGALYVASLDNPNLMFMMAEPIWLYISCLFIVVMFLGTVIKMLQISSGGLSIAKMVNARSLEEGPQSLEEQRFQNVVEEMAIASGTPVPQLFIMDDESINAFVAGTKPEDTVMVVTTGALQALNRDELQAVVGHEFSHIFNGDMKISLKLMGVLGGILIIGKIGHMILRARWYSSGSRSSNQKGNGLAFILIAGIGLLVVGYVGLFFGRMMKAAVSRQRELLADACSVQFTRNPHGLASAFRVMQAHEQGTHLKTKHVEDISHMCFGEAQWVMFGSLLATHPPLEARIKAIDPNDMYGILPRTNMQVDDESKKEDRHIGLDKFLPMMGAGILNTNAQAIEASIAAPGDEHVAYAIALAAAIPDPIRAAARQSSQVEALLYSLFLYQSNDEQEKALASMTSVDIVQQMEAHKAMLTLMEHVSFLPILDLSLQSFNRLEDKKKKEIFNHCCQLLEKGPGSPFHFALLTIIENQIKAKDVKPSIVKIEVVIKEITYVLAVLLAHSGQTQAEQQICFKQVLKKITSRNIAYPRLDTLNYTTLSKALNRLNLVTPIGKELVIKACIQCVMNDGKLIAQEGELLRAICEALGCPLPPILSQQNDSQ